MGAKSLKRNILIQQENRKADTAGYGDDRQMQGAKRKSMLQGGTKSKHEYSEGNFTA